MDGHEALMMNRRGLHRRDSVIVLCLPFAFLLGALTAVLLIYKCAELWYPSDVTLVPKGEYSGGIGGGASGQPYDMGFVFVDDDDSLLEVMLGKLLASSPHKNDRGLWGPSAPPLHRGLYGVQNALLHHLWENFKVDFNKTYQSIVEEARRFETFLENYLKILKHNMQFKMGHETYELRMNSFGDMTYGEFVSTMNGYKRSAGRANAQAEVYVPAPDAARPKEIDWRKLGLVTPVKNQKTCGSCWAFSATGSLEGQHMRKYGSLVSLSEQNLVDCSSKFGNMGCNGGLMDQAFDYIKHNKGIDTEESYPYEGIEGKCRFNKSAIGATDRGYVDIMKDNETALMLAVANVGPIAVAIDASQESFQFYHKGVYYERKCSPEELDHGVLVVGYGTMNGSDYWIVKNSWGPTWGDKGYVLMARNKRNNCGIASAASYPLV